MTSDTGGWAASAQAWVAWMGAAGDKGRRYVLDPAFRMKLAGRGFRRALDVGCGEGRMCRMMSEFGIAPVGVDPTPAMIEAARVRDPDGDYRLGSAERLPLDDGAFDLVVSCLSLIDIPDFRAAIFEMARVLAPGGTLLVANLTAVQSSGMEHGWRYDAEGGAVEFALDRYSAEWWTWVEWSGIRVRNWHRPLSAYVQAYLAAGFILVSYEDLLPIDGYPADDAERHARAPWFDLMEWRRP